MADTGALLRRLRDGIAVLGNRYFWLALGERALVGRKLSSGAFVPATAFVDGESLWLDPRVRAQLPANSRADVIVCRDRDANAWAASGPPASSVIARVTIEAGFSTEPIRLVDSLVHGTYDILLDTNQNGGFDRGDGIQGSHGPGITVLRNPAHPGPHAFDRHDLDFGVVSVSSGSITNPIIDVPVVCTLIRPRELPPGPLALIAHGNGFDRRHTVPLGELLASWGITAVCPAIRNGPIDRVTLMATLLERLVEHPLGGGLDIKRCVLLGHSASGAACHYFAVERDGESPFAGLVLLEARTGDAAPLASTPVLALVGTHDSGGAVPAASGSNVGIANLARSPAAIALVRGAYHQDFTYPTVDTVVGSNSVVMTVNAEHRRYAAGLAAAFCRRWLLGERATDVFLVDGINPVPEVDVRVAGRPRRSSSVRLEYGSPLSPREVDNLAGVLLERAEVIDHQLADHGVALWLRAQANGMVRWPLPTPLPIRPSQLSLHLALLANDPFDLSTSAPYEAIRAELDAGRIPAALATAFLAFFVEVDHAVPVVAIAGDRWTVACRTGRTYIVEAVHVANAPNGTKVYKLTAACDPPTNVPIGDRRVAVELADRAGNKSRIELRVPPPMSPSVDHGRVAALSGFRLPLSAFDVDTNELASVAIVALEPCELAIDHVELVASWD
jgi:hypothetical protein